MDAVSSNVQIVNTCTKSKYYIIKWTFDATLVQKMQTVRH